MADFQSTPAGIADMGARDSASFFCARDPHAESGDAGSSVGSSRDLRRYPGNKSADGVFHRIIGLMPPHDTYIEAFAGSGAIYMNKRPAKKSILIDLDSHIAESWRLRLAGAITEPHRSTTIIHGDARSILRDYPYTGRELVYCDPPYVMSARRNTLPLYRHEMTDDDHRDLLKLLNCVPCSVMISGYRSAIYDGALHPLRWIRFDFLAATHGGIATESVWCNFKLQALHDWRYLGEDFRQRERIKRKQARWRKRLAAMPALERAAMMAVLTELASSDAAIPAAPTNGELPV